VLDAFKGSDLPIIGPGLASGDPGWWNEELDPLVDAIAVHPYTKPPAEAADLLRRYHDTWPGYIWVTEFLDPGADTGLIPDYLAAFSTLPFVQVAFNYGRSPAWATGGGTVPEFKLGFAEYAKAHPEVGVPLTDEQYFDVEGDISVQ